MSGHPSELPVPLTVVQARMGSQRLPGKVLARIGERSVLEWVLHQLRQCEENLGTIVVATSVLDEDDLIGFECVRLGVPCFRGDPDDVLARFAACHEMYGGDPVVRVTADCPFLDPGLLDRVVKAISSLGYDYIGFHGAPDGYHQEALSAAALHAANREATSVYDREHVVPYVLERPDRFRVGYLRTDIQGEPITLDTAEDLERLRGMVA